MIAYLKGTIKHLSAKSVILEVNNVGYRVFVAPLFLKKLKVGQNVELYTYQYIRENLMELYGFVEPDILAFFSELVSISGVGPKTALAILSLAKLADIKSAIQQGDAALLTKVSGIGRKTAERIILEMGSRLKNLELSGSVGVDSDALDALVNLGYRLNEAREALQKVPAEIEDVGERVKETLKLLGR